MVKHPVTLQTLHFKSYLVEYKLAKFARPQKRRWLWLMTWYCAQNNRKFTIRYANSNVCCDFSFFFTVICA